MQTIRNASFVLLFSLCTVRAAAAQEAKVIATFTVHVVAGGESRKFPRVELLNGKRIMQLTREAQGETVELPVGTTIFLRFSSTAGTLGYTINPPGGVLESPPGHYHLPKGVVGLIRAEGAGVATITVREIHDNVGGKQAVGGGCSNCWSGYLLSGR